MKNKKVPKVEFYSSAFLKLLKLNMTMSQSTWHLVMNPYCSKCMAERGKKILRGK